MKTTAMKPRDNQKLMIKWKGPYEIKKMIGNETAQLDIPHRRNIKAHMNNLKKCYTGDFVPTDVPTTIREAKEPGAPMPP